MRARFRYLEIGTLPARPAPPEPPPAADKMPPETRRRAPCPHCGQPNVEGESNCWACLKPLTATAPVRPVILEAGEERSLESAAPGLSERRITVSEEGSYVVVRLNGNVYTSRDPDVPEYVRSIMDRVRAGGLTPQLMEELRREGPTVKYRPGTTDAPTDGDLNFWREAREPREGFWAPLAHPGVLTLAGMALMAGVIVVYWWTLQHVVFATVERIAHGG